MADTLLNCPFCGGKAEVLEITEGDEVANVGGSVVTCRKCGASSPVHFDRKENLVDSWNQRASLPQSQDIRGLVEPVAWQHRFQTKRYGEWSVWSEWLPGMADRQHEGTIHQYEDRALVPADALSCLAGEGWRPKVRPLVWATATFGWYSGNFHIEDNGDNWKDDRYWLYYSEKRTQSRVGKFASEQAAKDAAQTVHDADILSALDLPAPSVEEKLP